MIDEYNDLDLHQKYFLRVCNLTFAAHICELQKSTGLDLKFRPSVSQNETRQAEQGLNGKSKYLQFLQCDKLQLLYLRNDRRSGPALLEITTFAMIMH